jgi:uncharacterized protein
MVYFPKKTSTNAQQGKIYKRSTGLCKHFFPETGLIHATGLKDNMNIRDKEEKLRNILKGYGRLLIAFSGGVDSTFLLAVAHQVLNDSVLAATGVSLIHSREETDHAIRLAKTIGAAHRIFKTREMHAPEFLENNRNRCYVCKKSMIADLKNIAAENNIAHIAHGANCDDLHDFRPGLKAALESGVVSPLIEADLTKSDIRFLSRQMGLETWNKPAQPCLATRLPYGTPITMDGINRIAKAENVLKQMGIGVCRVRHHGDVARIEVSPADFSILIGEESRSALLNAFKEIGYLHVALDLNGYEQGSMNRGIA